MASSGMTAAPHDGMDRGTMVVGNYSRAWMEWLACAILQVVDNVEAQLGCYAAAALVVVQSLARLVVLMVGVQRTIENF